MFKKEIGRVIRNGVPSATGHKFKVKLPEADFFISNEKAIGDFNYGTFEYDTEDQFAKFIKGGI